jgi:hypothetical protein
MSEADDLVVKAQKQLDEHKTWLEEEIRKIDPGAWLGSGATAGPTQLAWQAREIKLRVVKASRHVVSVIYEYPDELYAFLSSGFAPKHLRDTLAGGCVVDPNQPTFTARRDAE